MKSFLQKDKFFMTKISFRLNITKKNDGLWNCKCPVNGCDNNNRKKRFFFVARPDHVLAYCHNCGYSASLRTFIKDQFPEFVDEYKFWGFTPKAKSLANQAKEAIENVVSVVDVIKKPLFISLEELNQRTVDFNLLSDVHPAKKYVQGRQIPFHLVRYCKNFYELSRHLHQDETFKNYPIPAMIIPFHRLNRKIEIIQARFFDPKIKPKYVTIKLNPEAPKIYNSDYIDESKPVWILEGPIDSMFVENSIALGGSDGSYQCNDQIWVWDNEPDNQNINKKIKRKIEEGEKVVIWKTSDNYKDINEGIMKKIIDKDSIQSILKERTYRGLKASLEFAKFRQ